MPSYGPSPKRFFCEESSITDIEIYTDSRNNLAWLDGRIGTTLNDRSAVMDLLETINNIRPYVKMTVTWIPRERNLAGQYIEQTANENVPAAK